MAINTATLDLIKRFEGLHKLGRDGRVHAYADAGYGWDRATIGYGHTSAAGPPRVYRGLSITKARAEQILRDDLRSFEAAVDRLVKVPLNANQRGALVSFCFNVGPGALARSSVLKAVNERRFEDVPARLSLWNKSNGRTLRGLTRRRAAEGALFETPAETPAPPLKSQGPLAVLVRAVFDLLTKWRK